VEEGGRERREGQTRELREGRGRRGGTTNMKLQECLRQLALTHPC